MAKVPDSRPPLVPQPHGGALRPITPTAARLIQYKTRSLRAIRREMRILLAEKTPKAAQTVIELMDDEDSRVRLVAAQEVLNRTLGRAGDMVGEDEGSRFDLSKLTDKQLDALRAALRAGIVKPEADGGGPVTIDATVVKGE